jgi:hypothetical protein
MTPAAQQSEAGTTADARASGAMNHGVPSSPRSERGSWSGLKKTARPKSTALTTESSPAWSSIKFPGLTSRWRMPRLWHWARVRRTARMKEAT